MFAFCGIGGVINEKENIKFMQSIGLLVPSAGCSSHGYHDALSLAGKY